MRLVFTTKDFVFGGRGRPGFPLILNQDMEPAQPFDAYLRHRLLERGRALDVKTWEAYGRRLWDFARFLDANSLAWNEAFASHGQSVVTVYRDWQAHDLKLEPSTVNGRLMVVTDMYHWAQERRLIERLPFAYSDVTVRGLEHDLAHVTGGRKAFKRPSVLLDEWEEEPAFLMAEQLKMARASIRSTSQRLLFDLMARVGLRSVEARTFPLSYVFDPTTRSALKSGTLIDVRLDPSDMEIKFDKPRVVHIPYSLMEDLHAYTKFERNSRADPAHDTRELILTAYGKPYSKESAIKVMKDLGRRMGFPIRPLMLRHSYAIHTLLLRKRPGVPS